MISRNGVVIEVGAKVLILLTPIRGGHEFIEGTIVGLNAKTAKVEAYDYYDKYSREKTLLTFNRLPEQVITYPSP